MDLDWGCERGNPGHPLPSTPTVPWTLSSGMSNPKWTFSKCGPGLPALRSQGGWVGTHPMQMPGAALRFPSSQSAWGPGVCTCTWSQKPGVCLHLPRPPLASVCASAQRGDMALDAKGRELRAHEWEHGGVTGGTWDQTREPTVFQRSQREGAGPGRAIQASGRRL